MKNISIILFLLLNTVVFSQNEVATFKESKVTSLIFTVDSVDELKTIDWDDVEEILKKNENTDESIILGFKVKNQEKDSGLKFKHSFEVKSKVSDLEGVIEFAKKVIKVIVKI